VSKIPKGEFASAARGAVSGAAGAVGGAISKGVRSAAQRLGKVRTAIKDEQYFQANADRAYKGQKGRWAKKRGAGYEPIGSLEHEPVEGTETFAKGPVRRSMTMRVSSKMYRRIAPRYKMLSPIERERKK
jgi:hypothetical protein